MSYSRRTTYEDDGFYRREEQMEARKPLVGHLVDDKGTWVVRAKVFNPLTQKAEQKSKTTGFKVKDSTKRLATKRMNEILAEWEGKSAENVRSPEQATLKYYIDQWLERKDKTTKAITSSFYRRNAYLHIIPAIGHVPITNLTLRVLQHYVDTKLEKLVVKSVKKHLIIIRGAIAEAAKDDIFVRDTTRYVEFPRAEKFEGKVYEPEQLFDLIKAASKVGEPYKAAVILMGVYGLRRSEACGLRWKDIDFTHNTIDIRNTIVQFDGSVVEEERTKTEGSRRTLDIMDFTRDYFVKLKEFRASQGFVCDKVVAQQNGNPLLPKSLARGIKDIMHKYNLPEIRIHDLRHTAASILLTNASPIQVQHFLGHQSLSTTTNIYAHILDKERKETSSIMNGILTRTNNNFRTL